jgi:hypothetical protein
MASSAEWPAHGFEKDRAACLASVHELPLVRSTRKVTGTQDRGVSRLGSTTVEGLKFSRS